MLRRRFLHQTAAAAAATSLAPAVHAAAKAGPRRFRTVLIGCGWWGNNILREAMASGEPVCGRLPPERHAWLFGDDAGRVASCAVLPVAGVGLVAVGSVDPNRFFPGMGTLFLRMMGEALATAMGRAAAR